MRHLKLLSFSILFMAFGLTLTAQTSSKLYSSGVMIRANETIKTYNITSNDAGVFTAQQNAIAQDGNQWNSPELLFDGQKLGSFEQSKGSILLDGFEIRTKKDNSLQNICRPIAYYSIIPEAATIQEAIYTQLVIPYTSTCNNGEYSDGNGSCDGEDVKNVWQKWSTSSLDIDLTNLTPGNYKLAIYFQLNGNNNGTSGCEILEYINKAGENFVASFTITPEVKETYAYAAGVRFINLGEDSNHNLYSIEKGGFSAAEHETYSSYTEYQLDGDFGAFVSGDAANNLILDEFIIKTKKSHSGQNICRPFVYLKIVNLNDGSETLEQFQIPYKATCDQGTFSDGWGVCDADDDKNIWQKWVLDLNKDLTQLNIGNYRAEMYFEIYGNENGTSGCDQLLQTIDNNGEMYNFLFEITPEIKEISLVGSAAKGWKNDIPMKSTDGINYSLKGYELIDSGVKFRQDFNWDTNWGSTDFPTGTGTQNGKNIPVKAGKYDITLNIETGEYAFVFPKYDKISLVYTDKNGENKALVPMETNDGVNYFLNDFDLEIGRVVFQNDSKDTWWQSYTHEAWFTNGTGFLDNSGYSDRIPLLFKGAYTFSFNIKTGDYSVHMRTEHTLVSIEDDSVPCCGSSFVFRHIPLKTEDGVHYWIERVYVDTGGFPIYVGHDQNKIRLGKSGDLTGFPTGFAKGLEEDYYSWIFIEGKNTGNYRFEFNLETYQYKLLPYSPENYEVISMIGNSNPLYGDVFLETYDGINYSLKNYPLTKGELVFRENLDTDKTWGSTSFPIGTASLNTQPITIEQEGYYDISFNVQTKKFSINLRQPRYLRQVSFNSATASKRFWMSTTDGINYSVNASVIWDTKDAKSIYYPCIKFLTDFSKPNSGIYYGESFPEGKVTHRWHITKAIGVTGNYDIHYNLVTGKYKFIKRDLEFPNVELSDKKEENPLDYSLSRSDMDSSLYTWQGFLPDSYEFRFSVSFLSNDVGKAYGILEDGSLSSYFDEHEFISIQEEGYYKITLNVETLDYSITPVTQNRTLSNNDLHDNLEEEVTYSPNPFQNVLNLSGVDLGNEVIINFYSLAGNLVHSIYNPTSNELDVNQLPNGMYIVHTTVNGETTVNKLIKE